MGELPRNVREFIVRDLIYIIGGGMVLMSFLYRFDRLPDEDTPLVFYLFAAGVAYVVGNVLQDVFSIFRFVTTAPVLKPGRIVKWIYQRFTNEDWKDIKDFDPTRSRRAIRNLQRKDQSYAASYERVISGLILAATMAPCTLISSLLIWWRGLVRGSQFDLCLAAMSLVLSAGLFVLTHMRAAQMARIDADAPAEDSATPEQSGTGCDAQRS